MSDVEKAYQEATEVISNAEAMYQKALGGFRSQIRNDIASIAASAQKVVTEAGKMQAAYLATANTLTTPQITEAIANAERLATALKAISELSQTKVAFAVMNGSGSA